MCAVTYQMRANYLHEAVDVYCEWIDEATEKKERLKKEREADGTTKTPAQNDKASHGGDLFGDDD